MGSPDRQYHPGCPEHLDDRLKWCRRGRLSAGPSFLRARNFAIALALHREERLHARTCGTFITFWVIAVPVSGIAVLRPEDTVHSGENQRHPANDRERDRLPEDQPAENDRDGGVDVRIRHDERQREQAKRPYE